MAVCSYKYPIYKYHILSPQEFPTPELRAKDPCGPGRHSVWVGCWWWVWGWVMHKNRPAPLWLIISIEYHSVYVFLLSYSSASIFRTLGIFTKSPCPIKKHKHWHRVWGVTVSPMFPILPKIVSRPHGFWLVQPLPFVAGPVLLTRYPVFSLLKPKGLSCTNPVLLVNCWWNAQMLLKL